MSIGIHALNRPLNVDHTSNNIYVITINNTPRVTPKERDRHKLCHAWDCKTYRVKLSFHKSSRSKACEKINIRSNTNTFGYIIKKHKFALVTPPQILIIVIM